MISSPSKKSIYLSPRRSTNSSPQKSPNRSPEKSPLKVLTPRNNGDLSPVYKINRMDSPKFTFLEAYEKGVIDHEIRDHKAKNLAAEYIHSKEYVEFKEYWIDKIYESLNYNIPNSLRTMFEKIIGIYHIEISYLDVSSMDSAVELVAPNDLNNLNFVLGCLIPIFTTIPYTFYKKLKLSIINICEEVKLMNESRIANFYQKLYGSWFFCLNVTDPEIIKRHFYNCLCYNLMKTYENFEEMWQDLNPKGHIDPVLVDESNLKDMRGYLNKECMISPIRDQFENFYLLLHYPNKMLNHHDKIIAKKAALMKEAIDKFDTISITPSWWQKRGLYVPTVKKNQPEETE